MDRKTSHLAARFLLAWLLCSGIAWGANDADLDTRFSAGGRVTFGIDIQGSAPTDRAVAVAGLQYPIPWLVGTASSTNARHGTGHGALRAFGNLDSSFGVGGEAEHGPSKSMGTFIAFTGNRAIVASDFDSQFLVERLNGSPLFADGFE